MLFINIDLPDPFTRADYEKIIENLDREVEKLNTRTGGLYSSVYTSYIQQAKIELEKRIVKGEE